MRVLLLAFFIAFSFQASSQCDFRNSINADISLDSTTFSKLIENQYSRLINGDSKTKPGNFAGLDLKDGQMTFNASKIFKKMRVITLNATGSIDGSTYAIFNNSKINSNISLELKYSWLSQQNQRLRTTDCEVLKRDNSIRYIDSLYEYSKSQFRNKRRFLVTLLARYKADEANISRADSLAKFELLVKIDSLNILLIKDFKDSLTKLTGLKNDWKKQRKAAQINIELTGYTINWWSIGYKVINKTFSTFQPSSPFGKQISKENYTSHAVSIEWNNSEWSNQPGESHYLQIGVDGFLNDNKDELKRLEITETNEYGSSPNLRTTTKKYFSYQGEYIKDLLGARIHADYFKFFFQENYCAFHVYPEIIYQKTEKPLYNVGVGFMYSFKDKKDEKEKALINAELYFNLKDLSNIGNSGKSLFERNEVGIRFGLPLKFFNN